MQPPYLSAGLAAAAIDIFSGGLGHTYTRTPVTVAAQDGWTRQVKTPGVPVTGVRCRYIARPHLTVTDGGRVLVADPPVHGGTLAALETLTVMPDDPLAVDYIVENVCDINGVLLFAGPTTVQAVIPHAGYGPATLKMVVLRGDTTERPV